MNKVGKLLHIRTGCLSQVRTLIEYPPLPEEGGIKYHGFTYYPRDPNFKDPPYNPSPLFLITRIKSVHGRNPVEKKALKDLNIFGKVKERKHIAIVKNTPDNCATLWKIKHLVKILPIEFPTGKPKEEDIGSMYLRDNGQVMITKKLDVNEERLVATQNFLNDEKKLNNKYMVEYLRLRWLNPLTKDL